MRAQVPMNKDDDNHRREQPSNGAASNKLDFKEKSSTKNFKVVDDTLVEVFTAGKLVQIPIPQEDLPGDDVPQKAVPQNAPLKKNNSWKENTGDIRYEGPPDLPFYLAKPTAQNVKPPFAAGAWICWFFIAVTAMWMVIPQSYTWFDPAADLHTHQQKAVAAFYRGDKKALKAECTEFLALRPDSAGAYFGRGYAFLWGKNGISDSISSAAAVPDFTQACRFAPDDYLFNVFLGLALVQSRNYSEAITVLERALPLSQSQFLPMPFDSIAKKSADITTHRLLAKSKLYEGRHQEALKDYLTYLDLSVSSLSDYADKMVAYEFAHNASAALKSGDRWMRYLGADGALYSPLALHDGALKRSIDIINKDKSMTAAINLLYDGMGYHGLQQYEKAIPYLNQAIALAPNYVDCYLFRAACYQHRNQNALAMADLSKALQIDPNNAYAKYMSRHWQANVKDVTLEGEPRWTLPN